MLRFRCPNCGGVIGVDETYADKQKDCPHCGNMVDVPDASRGVSAAAPTRPVSTLGAVALTVAVVVCLYQWGPWGLGSQLAVWLCVSGIVLGTVGIVNAAVRKRTGTALPFIATIVCMGALAMILVTPSRAPRRRSGRVLAAEATVRPRTRITGTESPSPPPAEVRARIRESSRTVWTPASSAERRGDFEVRVASAEVRSTDGEDVLAIQLSVKNVSENRKLSFSGWTQSQPRSAFGLGVREKTASESLTDNFGNTYSTRRLDAEEHGTSAGSSLYPGQSISDVLAFEAPVKTFKFLHLDLASGNLPGTAHVRFEIPAEMVKRQKTD